MIFHSITSGAANDIEQATKIARSMITRLGMSEQFGMTALETVNNRYLGQDATLACSDQTATKIDEEVVKLIQDAYQQAYRILEENKDKLHELAKFLYEKETITGEQFMAILNRPRQIETKRSAGIKNVWDRMHVSSSCVMAFLFIIRFFRKPSHNSQQDLSA